MAEGVPRADDRDSEAFHDENAYGLLISWYDAEETEYAQSSDKFPPRLIVLRAAIDDYLASFPAGEAMSCFDFGTTFYFEIGDGDQSEDLIGWMRSMRALLAQGDWRTFAVVTYGGRWVANGEPPSRETGKVRLMVAHGPSEPMRRAMAAEGRSHDDEEAGEEGWGPGLFVDLEALEAMGRKLKNQPTTVRAGGTDFVRVSA